MLIDTFLIFVLIVFYGWLSLNETAYLSIRKARLDAEGAGGNDGAQRVLKLVQHPGFFTSIRILSTITALALGYFICKFLYSFVSQPITFFLLFTAALLSIVMFGELLPKNFSSLAPEKVAKWNSAPLSAVIYLALPFHYVAVGISNFIIDIFGLRPARESGDAEEEVMAIMSEASHTGDIEKEERSIVESVFVLGDATAGDIMTNKPDLIYVDLTKSLQENKAVIQNSDHYVVPVCEGSLDNVVGVLNIKSILRILLQNQSFEIKALMEKPLFVPENMKALKLFDHLKIHHSHMAIVVDEYGSVKGAVTVNDLYKVLVKDIYHEDENTDPEIFIRADGSALIDGLISVDKVFKYLKITNTDEIEQQGFYTLGGLILYISKNIPKEGDVFIWQGYVFEVMDMDGKRVDKVLITKQLEQEVAIPAPATAKG